jgi:hypothetical protein
MPGNTIFVAESDKAIPPQRADEILGFSRQRFVG